MPLRDRVSSTYTSHQKIALCLASQLIRLNKNPMITWCYGPLLSYSLSLWKVAPSTAAQGPWKALVIVSNHVPFHVYCAFP